MVCSSKSSGLADRTEASRQFADGYRRAVSSVSTPHRIGRYRVVEHAGSGAFASVFAGVDDRLGSPVAIKLLADNWLYDPDVRRRFRDEAALARRLTTEGGTRSIVQVFDIDQTADGRPFFVMEWAAGGTLAERMRDTGWSITDITRVVTDLANGMAGLHRAGVIHRDIKPSNLLICGSGDRGSALLGEHERLVLGDLGLAKDLTDENSALSLVAGTDRYLAPEALTGGASVGPEADIFAATQVVAALVAGNADAEKAFASFIDAGTEREPTDRPPTAVAWLELFRRSSSMSTATAETSAEPGEASRPNPGRRRAAIAVGVVAVALGLLGLSRLSEGSSSAIRGPAEVVSGEQAVYSIEGVDEDLRWLTSSGRVVTGPTLEVVGRLPGSLRMAVTHDGEQFERTVRVVPSPVGPEVRGPISVRSGEPATWSVADADGQRIEWSTTDGSSGRGPTFTFVPLDDVVVQVIAVDASGIARGAQLEVAVD